MNERVDCDSVLVWMEHPGNKHIYCVLIDKRIPVTVFTKNE